METESEPEQPPEAAGYTFYNADLEVIWVSSVPRTDEEARGYIQMLFGVIPEFIHARRHDNTVEAI